MEEAQTMDMDIDVVSCIPMLQRYALKLARNGPDADDLVQDCLLRALSRQHQFEPGTNLVAWLTTILRNLFFNGCKRKRRMAEVELEPDALEASLDAPQDHRVELGDTQRALQGLSDVQKQVVQRCGVEGARKGMRSGLPRCGNRGRSRFRLRIREAPTVKKCR